MLKFELLPKKTLKMFARAERALKKIERLDIRFKNNVPVHYGYDKNSDIPSKLEMEALCFLISFTRYIVEDRESKTNEEKLWDKIFKEGHLKMVEEYFYACLEFYDGTIVRELFTNRAEARDYIAKHRDDEGVKSSWTE